jgi:hypothetical protein
MKKTYFIFYLLGVMLFTSCSKDPVDDTGKEVETTPVCELRAPASGCFTAYLEGNPGEWMQITETGESLEPLFLYQTGDSSNPWGTVTITMKTAVPAIRINDSNISDVRVVFSRDAQGVDSECFLLEDIPAPASEDDPAVTVRSNRNYILPFYIQIEGNVCQ